MVDRFIIPACFLKKINIVIKIVIHTNFYKVQISKNDKIIIFNSTKDDKNHF